MNTSTLTINLNIHQKLCSIKSVSNKITRKLKSNTVFPWSWNYLYWTLSYFYNLTFYLGLTEKWFSVKLSLVYYSVCCLINFIYKFTLRLYKYTFKRSHSTVICPALGGYWDSHSSLCSAIAVSIPNCQNFHYLTL